MPDSLSITEVGRVTGLASHTIRYYETQFPLLLNVERSKGGHRIYRTRHLDALNSIIKLLKDEKVSIRVARKMLGEADIVDDKSSLNCSESCCEAANSQMNKTLQLVLARVELLCESNERRDALLESIVKQMHGENNAVLLDQISRCRHETRKTMRLYESIVANHNEPRQKRNLECI